MKECSSYVVINDALIRCSRNNEQHKVHRKPIVDDHNHHTLIEWRDDQTWYGTQAHLERMKKERDERRAAGRS